MWQWVNEHYSFTPLPQRTRYLLTVTYMGWVHLKVVSHELFDAHCLSLETDDLTWGRCTKLLFDAPIHFGMMYLNVSTDCTPWHRWGHFSSAWRINWPTWVLFLAIVEPLGVSSDLGRYNLLLTWKSTRTGIAGREMTLHLQLHVNLASKTVIELTCKDTESLDCTRGQCSLRSLISGLNHAWLLFEIICPPWDSAASRKQ